MSPLDPIITRQFGWAGGRDAAALMSNPTLIARFVDSYRDDPEYAPPSAGVSDYAIDGPLGPRSLFVRVYSPDVPRSRAALVWAHGGGFMGGSIDDLEADGVAREISARAGIVVATVDYHVATPSLGYPNLHREVMAAHEWVRSRAQRWGIDAERLSLGGASAGANLAVAATLELRDARRPMPAALVLAYPLLHAVLMTEPGQTFEDVPEALRIRQASVDMMLRGYRAGTPSHATRYATVDGHEPSGLPPMLIVVNEYDDLLGSGRAFARAAAAGGSAVVEYLARGVPHGHLAMTARVPETARTLQQMSDFICDASNARSPAV